VDEVNSAYAQLRILQLQEAIAQETMLFAQTRLQELAASGVLSPKDYTRLLDQVGRELAQLQDEVTRSQSVVTLHDLQHTRQEITALYKRTMSGLDTEIKEIRTALLAEHSAWIDASPHPRSLTVVQPARVSSTPWYLQSKVILPLILLVVLVSTSPFTFGLLSDQRIMSSSGIVAGVNLGVYADSAGTTPLTRVEWGLLYPGDVIAQELYIRNAGNQATTLQLETANWSPSQASAYLTLSWDYGNELVQPDETIRVTLSLTLASDVQDIQDFSFDIVLTMIES
jgi:hypothetical protein